MADLWLDWDDDWVLGANNDLVIADGDDEVRQRLQRRLFTAVKDYIWHQEYGAGLPQKIGDPWTPAQISAIVTSQVNMEASVAISPPVQISVGHADNQLPTVLGTPGEIVIGIFYHDAVTGDAVSFQIAVPTT